VCHLGGGIGGASPTQRGCPLLYAGSALKDGDLAARADTPRSTHVGSQEAEIRTATR
jgi:hypothetical protein